MPHDQSLLIKTAGNIALEYLRISSANPACTKTVGPYQKNMDLPAVPVIHPYNPNAELGQDRIDAGIAKFSVVINFSTSNDDEIAAILGVGEIQNFIVMQNNPWQNVDLLFRPHPWVHNTAPEQAANYNQANDLEVWFSYLDHSKSIGKQNISTHSAAENMIMFSPNNMSIAKEHSGFSKTNTFYSACIDRANNKAAITMHVLLNDDDSDLIQDMALNSNNELLSIASLMQDLKNKPNGISTAEIELFLNGSTPSFDPTQKRIAPSF